MCSGLRRRKRRGRRGSGSEDPSGARVSCEAYVMEMGEKSICDGLRPCELLPDWRTSTDVIQWRASEASPKDGERPPGHLRPREEHEDNTPRPGSRGKASSSAQQGVFPRHSRREKRQAAGSCLEKLERLARRRVKDRTLMGTVAWVCRGTCIQVTSVI